MGKGDKKTRKGKISMGSYGVSRPQAASKPAVPVPEKKPKA
ncbi:30S ribosomal protein THX [Spirosoma areae]